MKWRRNLENTGTNGLRETRLCMSAKTSAAIILRLAISPACEDAIRLKHLKLFGLSRLNNNPKSVQVTHRKLGHTLGSVAMTKRSVSRWHNPRLLIIWKWPWIGVGSKMTLGTGLCCRSLGFSDLRGEEQISRSFQEFTTVSKACEWESQDRKNWEQWEFQAWTITPTQLPDEPHLTKLLVSEAQLGTWGEALSSWARPQHARACDTLLGVAGWPVLSKKITNYYPSIYLNRQWSF